MTIQFKIFICCIILIIIGSCSEKTPTTSKTFNTLDENVDAIAKKYMGVGMMIGIIDNDQKIRIYSYGTKSTDTNDTPDENTVFDIGSMTKTFTATLLTDSYLRNDFTDDTVSHYLPDSVVMPTYNGIPVRIIHLATHTSGLPRTPHADGQSYPTPDGFNIDNPYEVYTTDHIYDYLSNYCCLEFEPGTQWQYSNTGYGILGHLVGKVNNSTYENVLQDWIFDELDMTRSSVILNNDQLTNYSLGYSDDLENVSYYTANDIFQGAGFIKSTLNDLFKYLEANMGLTETRLRNAMDLTHESQTGEQALGWYLKTLNDGQSIIYSGGDTQGHSSFIGFNKSTMTGAIILSNSVMHGSQLNMGYEIIQAINELD